MSREGLSPWWIGGALVLTILGSIGVGYWLIQKAPVPAAPTQLVAGDSSAEEATAVALTEPPVKPVLPPLAESDALIRDMVQKLSDHPQIMRWVAPEDLVRRLVASVDNIARGESPVPHLQHMEPEGEFVAAGGTGTLTVDPRTYARYDLLAEVFTSLDIGSTVRLYYDLEPLLEEAYQELGDPSRSFADTLDLAIGRLLDTPVPETEPILEQHALVYRFQDAQWEELNPASKHLLRLGPENARRVKGKLTFLRAALDLGRRSQENFDAAASSQP